MRILLILPPNVEFLEPFRSSRRKPPALLWGFPLGLGYLAAVLKQKGFEVRIIDACFEGIPIEELLKQIKEYDPDIVGIGCLTHILRSAIELAGRVKLLNNEIKIVMGGPHSTYDYQDLLRAGCIDQIVIGEGERTFPELCSAIEQGAALEGIKGIAFVKNGELIKTHYRELVDDLDSLPFPARELVDFGQYIQSYGVLEKSVDVMSSRGCTNRCVFCSSGHLFGKWRTRSVGNIITEVRSLLKEYPGIKSINFMDDDFTADKGRVLDLCATMKKEGLNTLNWVCLARVDQLDEENVSAMKSAGCVRVHLGIESGSEEILKNINKRISLEQAKKAVRLLEGHKIEAYSFFMVGHPGETTLTIKKTVAFARGLRSSNTGFFITQVFPGTRLAELQPVGNWVDYIYEPEIKNPSLFTHPCVPNFLPSGFDRERLKKICGRITRGFIILHFFRRWPMFLKKFFTEPRQTVNYVFKVFFNK